MQNSQNNLTALIMGDVMGKPGRKALERLLPWVRERYQPDIILANGENAAGGFGLTEKVYHELTDRLGVTCLTMGNHWADKREIMQLIPKVNNIVLPGNMYNVELEQGFRILNHGPLHYAVINLLGEAFMKGDQRSIFKSIETILARIPSYVKIRFVDLHGETSSEKQALAHFLRGRVTAVYGTHTHCPTADERLIGSTAFVTDVGMTGPYDSVIGIDKEAAIRRFVEGVKKNFGPAVLDLWLTGLVLQIDKETGHCLKVERILIKEKELAQSRSEENPS